LRYDRSVLVTVLIYHQRQSIQYCHCGWGEIGKSHPEHVASEYEKRMTEIYGPTG